MMMKIPPGRKIGSPLGKVEVTSPDSGLKPSEQCNPPSDSLSRHHTVHPHQEELIEITESMATEFTAQLMVRDLRTGEHELHKEGDSI